MKDDQFYLIHIRECLEWIEKFTSEGKKGFLSDKKTQDAGLRNIEVIGEAVKHLSSEYRNAHAGIPWKQMAGMRDKLIHEYFGVNLDLVWEVVEKEIPKLKKELFAP
ncbi:MAG: DUF86 domain-containing protein [Deltaproteobacteria bacterium]|nr:DUF86 domain-containing protein [Deltaproteobacteria bacterium]